MGEIQVIIAGNITIDDIVLQDGTTYMHTIGGDVLYAAMGSKFWLDGVGLLSRANRAFLDEYAEKFTGAGLDIEGMPAYGHEIVRNWIIYDTGQRRHFIYRNDFELLKKLSPQEKDVPARYLSAKAVFLAAMAIENQISLAKYFKAKGMLVLADPLDDDVTAKPQLVGELIRYVDIFMPSAEEIHRIFENNDYKRNARKLAEMGPRAVVIKLGPDGCLIYDKERDCFHTLPAYNGRVVDLTGAGDCFGGGFTAGYVATGGDLIRSAAMGSISSSFAIDGFGSMPLFDKTPQMAATRLQEYLAAL